MSFPKTSLPGKGQITRIMKIKTVSSQKTKGSVSYDHLLSVEFNSSIV